MLRKATKDDKKVLEGLGEFIESLELDILNEVSKEIFYDILTYIFESEEDRFSHKYCNARSKFGLSDNSIIFDYDEMLEGEYYLDTLYVFSESREKGVGNKLLEDFTKSSYPLLSLNVAQSNYRARKLYESFNFKKECEVFIGHENYDHMVIRK